MAERRMFAKTIIDSDAFLDMPLSTQSLYFHLSMRADDDGFINNPRKIQRMIGASEDDLKLLIAKNFIIPFESGIVVIKHWKIHNYIRNDRYKETVYKEEKAQLEVKNNKSYTLGIPDVYQMDTQVRLGKVSIGKDNINNISASDEAETCSEFHQKELYEGHVLLTPEEFAEIAEFPDYEKYIKKAANYIRQNGKIKESHYKFIKKLMKETKHKYGEYNNVLLTDDELHKLKTEYSDYKERIERLSSYVASTGKKYRSHYATIRNWARKDAEKQPAKRKEMVPGWMSKEKTQYDFDELENELLANKPVMVKDDPDLAKRAEDLKQQLQEKQ